MTTHHFTLSYEGLDPDDFADLADDLVHFVTDDLTVALRAGLVHVSASRPSATPQAAVISALADVERLGQPLRLVGVEFA